MTTVVYKDGCLYTDTHATYVPMSDEQKSLIEAIKADEAHPLRWHFKVTSAWRLAMPDLSGIDVSGGKYLDCRHFQINGEQVVAAAFAGSATNAAYFEHHIANGVQVLDALKLAHDNMCEVLGEEHRLALTMQVLAVTKTSVYFYTLEDLYSYQEYKFNRDETIAIGSGSVYTKVGTIQEMMEVAPLPSLVVEKFHRRPEIKDVHVFFSLAAKKDEGTNNDVKMRRC